MDESKDKKIYVYRSRHGNKSVSRRLYVSRNYKVCMITEGEAVWQVGAQELHVKKGDIVLLSTQHQRVFKKIFTEDGIELLVVEFGVQLFHKHFQGLLLNRGQQYDCQITGQPQVNTLFAELEKETQEKNCHYEMMQEAKLVEILVLLGRKLQIQDLDDVQTSGEMYEILMFLNENYTSEISLKDAADVLHMTENGFSRYFSKCMGMGFAQYLMQRRIGHAIELLKSSEQTVLEIALECGYHNTASFYKAFRKITHMTPKDYRNRKENFYI